MATPDFPLVARDRRPDGFTVRVGDVAFGGGHFVVVAGPCAVETAEQLDAAARAVSEAGARVLRGGIFKPRTSPHSYQGIGREGLDLLERTSREHGLPFVTEVMHPDDVAAFAPRVDAFQVGARNMQNFELLRQLGAQDRPVVLKRSFGARVEEWLKAAEYVVQAGNEQIILCERGIRTFETATRFTLDLAGAVWAKRRTFLPVIVDPSHGTGLPELVEPMTRAAAAAGLDGAMIEVHPDPADALSDGEQSLDPEAFRRLMVSLDA